MNAMKIVIGFIVVLYLVFILISLFSAAFPKEETVNIIKIQLEHSKKNLGEFKAKYNIKFSKGILLTKKDFETKNTIIEFECNSYNYCCSENSDCEQKIEWTKEKTLFNEEMNPIVSTRCEELQGIYFCKIYLGEIPAQIKLEKFIYNNDFYFNSEKLKIESTITNTGNTAENYARMETTVFIAFFEEGTKKQEKIKTENSERTKIEAKETKKLQQEIQLNSPGEYMIKTKITGLNFGFIEKEFTVNVFGEPEYECRINEEKKDITIDPETVGENKITECQIRHYCTDCRYAFECKNKWENTMQFKEFELGTKNYAVEQSKGTNCTE